MSINKPLLTIQVPTVIGREKEFEKLRDEIFRQGQEIGAFKSGELEFMMMKDNKEISIGMKRRLLYQSSNGKYTVQWDDDDGIHKDGIALIINALRKNPDVDCVTYKELCIFDGTRVESSNHSLKYKSWMDNHDGFNHVRTPFCKNVIKTELCRQAIMPDMRFGEDHEFAKSIYPLLKTGTWINEFIYIYQHNSTPHNIRYGVK